MTAQQSQRMFDANVRVEKMFWIGGACASAPNDFEEFVEEDLAEAKEVLKSLPWLGEPDGTAEDILSEFAFRDVDGFIVQLATPVPSSFSEEGGYSFSWGYYRTEWFFFDTLDALTDRAEAWAKEVVEKARAKAAA